MRIFGQGFDLGISGGWLCVSNPRARALVARFRQAIEGMEGKEPRRLFAARGRLHVVDPLEKGPEGGSALLAIEFHLRRAGRSLVGSISGP